MNDEFEITPAKGFECGGTAFDTMAEAEEYARHLRRRARVNQYLPQPEEGTRGQKRNHTRRRNEILAFLEWEETKQWEEVKQADA